MSSSQHSGLPWRPSHDEAEQENSEQYRLVDDLPSCERFFTSHIVSLYTSVATSPRLLSNCYMNEIKKEREQPRDMIGLIDDQSMVKTDKKIPVMRLGSPKPGEKKGEVRRTSPFPGELGSKILSNNRGEPRDRLRSVTGVVVDGRQRCFPTSLRLSFVLSPLIMNTESISARFSTMQCCQTFVRLTRNTIFFVRLRR